MEKTITFEERWEPLADDLMDWADENSYGITAPDQTANESARRKLVKLLETHRAALEASCRGTLETNVYLIKVGPYKDMWGYVIKTKSGSKLRIHLAEATEQEAKDRANDYLADLGLTAKFVEDKPDDQ